MLSDTLDLLRPNVSLYFGEKGLRWLAGLEAQLPDLARTYDLHIAPPFPDLSINYVAPAVRSDGTEVVLKLGVPNPEIEGEIASLRAFGGSGAVRLLEADPESGLLLLERIRPGSPAPNLQDDDATASESVGFPCRSNGSAAPLSSCTGRDRTEPGNHDRSLF